MPSSSHVQTLLLFGLRLKDVRLQFGYPLEACAARLGISPSHLCNLENGRREPSFGLLADIACSLSVSLDYLILGRTDGMRDSALLFRSDDELLATFVTVPQGVRGGGPEA